MARHHKDAVHAFKRFRQGRPVGKFGNDRSGVLVQNLACFIGIAHDTDRRLTELRELFHDGPAGVAGRPNNGNHGFLPSLVVFQRKFYLR